MSFVDGGVGSEQVPSVVVAKVILKVNYIILNISKMQCALKWLVGMLTVCKSLIKHWYQLRRHRILQDTSLLLAYKPTSSCLSHFVYSSERPIFIKLVTLLLPLTGF